MNHDVKSRVGIDRQIKLPNSEAFKIALRSIKIRFWRSLITMVGIVLAIAFLSAVMTTGAIERGIAEEMGEDVLAVTLEAARSKRLWLIFVAMLICVVGISNAMLMSVTERYREIGTMKCLGALDWFVVKLFLIEAGFQGLIGSTLGAILGVMAAVLASALQYEGVIGMTPWGSVMLSGLFAIAIGMVLSIIGAIYPARRAGLMPPADAMRTEV